MSLMIKIGNVLRNFSNSFYFLFFDNLMIKMGWGDLNPRFFSLEMLGGTS